MQTATETLRTLLWLDLIGVALIALAALQHRRLSLARFTFWGLITICLPLVGPFLALLWGRPGPREP